MALFNYATKELTLKVVYYGPGLSGKTTNLQYLHSVLNPQSKGKLLSLSTEADRTLFFDFLPFELGKIRDFSVRFQLYTVPGQIRYNATRKVVLKGADAVVFVVDSQRAMSDQNIESYENMKENLLSNNINPAEIPIVLQYNKRDLRDICPVDELNEILNREDHLFLEASAISGTGVEETFKLVSRLLLKNIGKKHKIDIGQEEGPVEEPLPSAHRESFETGVAEHTAPPRPSGRYGEAGLSVDVGTEEGTAARVRPAETSADRKSRDLLKDKIDILLMEYGRMNEVLSDMKRSVSELQKEIRTLRDMQKAQEQTNRYLSDLRDAVSELKVKKSWFRF